MIDVRRLRVLRALADHGTVSAAAQALHLTPSAVSQQLAALEREGGRPVAERGGRGLVLTGTADVLLEHAHALFAQLERAEADGAADAGGELGTVVVGAFHRAGRGVRVCHRDSRSSTHPLLRVRNSTREPARFARWARRRSTSPLDGVRERPAPGDPRFARRALLDDPLDAAQPVGHPLAARAAVALDALADDTWVGPSPGTSCLEVTLAGCAAAGFTPRLVHRTNDFTTLMAFVGAGLGVGSSPASPRGGSPTASRSRRCAARHRRGALAAAAAPASAAQRGRAAPRAGVPRPGSAKSRPARHRGGAKVETQGCPTFAGQSSTSRAATPASRAGARGSATSSRRRASA